MANNGMDFKKIFLAGVGAVAISVEKTKDLVDELVKKGEITVEQGKVLNEELKHDFKQKIKSALDIPDNVTAEVITEKMESMSAEEIEAIKAKLAEMESEKCKCSQEDSSEATE